MMRNLSIVMVLLVLAGCGLHNKGGYYQDDGPPRWKRVKIDRIPDAVPKKEPLSRSGNAPYSVNGKTYHPMDSAKGYRKRGVASWYGKKFHGNRTSSGERYNMYAMSAAHKTLPLPSYVRVTNLRNGKSVVVKVNDRGPFLHNRLIDLSYVAAAKLGILATGTGMVEVRAVGYGDDDSYRGRTEPVKVAPIEDKPKAKQGKLYIQVGAFRQWDNADRLRARLRRADLGPVVIQSIAEGKGRLYRVRIGPLANANEGERLGRKINKIGINNTQIVVD